jgi:peroxiredoxin
LSLKFDLLVDDGLGVAAAYGALRPEGGRIQRTVVIVGKNGKVIYWAQGAPPPGELLSAIAAAHDD